MWFVAGVCAVAGVAALIMAFALAYMPLLGAEWTRELVGWIGLCVACSALAFTVGGIVTLEAVAG